MVEHFQMLARYNRLANQRLLAACARLSPQEFERPRFGSFGTIPRTLNHILLADQVWMGRFEGLPPQVTQVDGVPYPGLPAFTEARLAEDLRIEKFMDALTAERLAAPLHYTNLAGKPFSDPFYLVLGHMFNHQTHHRGQVHVMLSDAGVTGLSLDMHRLVNPA